MSTIISRVVVMAKLFGVYKNSNLIVKVVFLIVFLLMGGLWVIGSFTKIDRLVMFMVGTIIGGILVNIFLYDYVTSAINYISSFFNFVCFKL